MPSKAFRDGDSLVDGKSTSKPKRERNVVRGVWELARLHTRQSYLACFPAWWGACIAVGNQDITLDVHSFAMALFGVWASATASHCTFCTLNDICDQDFDAHVERTKIRPLPAGLISTTEAIIAFIAWLPITLAITYFTLGEAVVISSIPIWTLCAFYPLAKRVFNYPQLVVGASHGAGVFPGWGAITQNPGSLRDALPLFFATTCWVMYFDLFYATQDAADDQKIGVKSLAVLVGESIWLVLSVLGLLQVGFFVQAGIRAELSVIFWVLGLGVWTLSIPWNIAALDITDRRSGGRILEANIKLGLYMTVIFLAEVLSTRVQF